MMNLSEASAQSAWAFYILSGHSRVFRSFAPVSVKGNYMRKLVNPPPWSRCGLCSGEMRLKLIEPADHTCDLENEIFVCANCGHERTFTVMHDPYTPHIEKTSAKT